MAGAEHFIKKKWADGKRRNGASSDLRSESFDNVALLKEITENAEDSLVEVEHEEVVLGDVDQEELFAIGTKTSNPLRLRGGGAGKEDSDDTSAEEAPDKEPSPKESRRLEKKRSSSCIGRMEKKEGRVKKDFF